MAIETNLPPAGVPSSQTQLDTILQSQHFGPRPEQWLMMAVLRDAFACVETYRFATNTHGQRLFREAQKWFLAADATWPYSFEHVCAVLGLDSMVVRQRLRVAPESQPVPESRAERVFCAAENHRQQVASPLWEVQPNGWDEV